jgi:hypothetical protein
MPPGVIRPAANQLGGIKDSMVSGESAAACDRTLPVAFTGERLPTGDCRLSILRPLVRLEARGGKTMRFNRVNVTLWAVQGLLAALFLFAGAMKLLLPIEALAGPMPLPGPFLRFIGVAEVLGAVGLILPWLLRIRPSLTPLAAVGLVIIMSGATAITVMGGAVAPALIPLVVGALAATVAYGRWRPA